MSYLGRKLLSLCQPFPRLYGRETSFSGQLFVKRSAIATSDIPYATKLGIMVLD